MVQYVLDGLYEMLFFNMAGRDATDGRYALPVKVSGNELIAEEPVHVGAYELDHPTPELPPVEE